MTPLIYMLMGIAGLIAGLALGGLALRRRDDEHKTELAARDATINRQGGEILSAAVRVAAAERRTAEVDARVSRVLADIEAERVVAAVESQRLTWADHLLRGVEVN
jgi:hypothetical protein